MKHYKDKDGNVYAYEEDGSQDHLIGNKKKMTDAAVKKHIASYQSKGMTQPDAAPSQRSKIAEALGLTSEELDKLVKLVKTL